MSKSKHTQPCNIVEDTITLIEDIRNATLKKVSDYFFNRKIYYQGGILKFIRNPIHYPGDISKIRKIVKVKLWKSISEYLSEIKQEKLNINFIIQSVINSIFRRGRTTSGSPGVSKTLNLPKIKKNKSGGI